MSTGVNITPFCFRDAASKSEFCNLTIFWNLPYDVIPDASLKLSYFIIQYGPNIIIIKKLTSLFREKLLSTIFGMNIA